MAESDGEARARTLANEMQILLEQNLLQDPATTDIAMARVREIRKDIASMGFMVTWEAQLNMHDLQTLNVTVTLWKPKSNLSPEDQKIYDDWFRLMNDIANA